MFSSLRIFLDSASEDEVPLGSLDPPPQLSSPSKRAKPKTVPSLFLSGKKSMAFIEGVHVKQEEQDKYLKKKNEAVAATVKQMANKKRAETLAKKRDGTAVRKAFKPPTKRQRRTKIPDKPKL